MEHGFPQGYEDWNLPACVQFSSFQYVQSRAALTTMNFGNISSLPPNPVSISGQAPSLPQPQVCLLCGSACSGHFI